MSYTVQVVVDSVDPHGLADWWAETLGWDVEPQDEAFIRSMIEQGQATEAETTTHHGALVWRTGAAIVPPADAPGSPGRVLFQLVPETKSVKNRLHFDLRFGDDDPELVRARLIERGATVIGGGSEGPHTWVTLTDPEGNEFCV